MEDWLEAMVIGILLLVISGVGLVFGLLAMQRLLVLVSFAVFVLTVIVWTVVGRGGSKHHLERRDDGLPPGYQFPPRT